MLPEVFKEVLELQRSLTRTCRRSAMALVSFVLSPLIHPIQPSPHSAVTMKLGSSAEGLVGSDIEFPEFDPLVSFLFPCWLSHWISPPSNARCSPYSVHSQNSQEYCV